jgi:adenylate cyclase
MPMLTIHQPGVASFMVRVGLEEVTIGRAENNTVVLVADEVSRHHARMCFSGGRTVLIDMKSLNGTYVNRQQVMERVLSDGDEIWFGSKCRAEYREDPVDISTKPAMAPDTSTPVDLDSIRRRMDQLGDSMTMIGKRSGQADPLVADPKLREQIVSMARAYRRLEALYKASNQASKLIASNATLEQRLAAVLDTAMEVTEAERGFVMLREETTGNLRVMVAREMGMDLHDGSPSMGIADQSARNGEAVLMRNSGQDARFSGRESIISQRIESAMCVPLKVEDRILGSVYVDARKAGSAFEEEDLELFASMASQSAMAIENAQLTEKMLEAEKKRANLGRFFSPAIVDAIMSEQGTVSLGGRRALVTTMFCDIRSFTPIAEQLPSTVVVDMLNEHFTAMVKIVFDFDGTLDKYIGDEIMAVFGAPAPLDGGPALAVRAALAMQARNDELNLSRTARGLPLFELGIGIETGEVSAGFIGAPERMEYTVVGDRVNTARRLCALAEAGQVVVSGDTWAHMTGIAEGREIGPVQLKGKEHPVVAHEVLRMLPGA